MKLRRLDELRRIASVREIYNGFDRTDADRTVAMSDRTEALQEFIQFCDNFTRLPALIEGWELALATEREWLAVLGDRWTTCDNPSRYADDLRLNTPFGLVADGMIPNSIMMSPAERECLNSLPEEFPIFRGCYNFNRKGISWSLDQEVARRFPYMHRFHRPGRTPLLIEAAVQKRDVIAFKMDRDEAEVVALRSEVVSVTELPHSL